MLATTKPKLTVVLPWPDAKLNPNARVHWRASAPLKASYKDDCYWLTKHAAMDWEPLICDIPLSITFVQPDMRKRDVDNMLASIKSAIDGFALALGVNDRQFRPLTVDWKRGKKPGSVIVEVA